MHLDEILTPTFIQCHIDNITTKKQALEAISTMISDADARIKFQDVVEALQKRERLGSTAIGYGVAIPHARIKNLTRATCLLITLKSPIDFDSADELHNQPVDILFALLVPEEATQAHLDLLSEIATKLKNKHYRDAIRNATNAQALFNIAKDHISEPHHQ